jgi:hypothetical protein
LKHAPWFSQNLQGSALPLGSSALLVVGATATAAVAVAASAATVAAAAKVFFFPCPAIW